MRPIVLGSILVLWLSAVDLKVSSMKGLQGHLQPTVVVGGQGFDLGLGDVAGDRGPQQRGWPWAGVGASGKLITMKNLSKAGVGVGVGVAGLALAKSGGALKAVALAFAGLFSHGGAGEVATLAPAVTRSAVEVSALAPSLRGTPGELGALATGAREAGAVSPVGRAMAQTLVRVPGQERQQLPSLVGEQRDRFLVLVCREDVKALGLRAYLGGAFRDWVPETVAAFGRLGLGRAATLLTEARTLPGGSPRWAALEQEFLTSGLP